MIESGLNEIILLYILVERVQSEDDEIWLIRLTEGIRLVEQRDNEGVQRLLEFGEVEIGVDSEQSFEFIGGDSEEFVDAGLVGLIKLETDYLESLTECFYEEDDVVVELVVERHECGDDVFMQL